MKIILLISLALITIVCVAWVAWVVSQGEATAEEWQEERRVREARSKASGMTGPLVASPITIVDNHVLYG